MKTTNLSRRHLLLGLLGGGAALSGCVALSEASAGQNGQTTARNSQRGKKMTIPLVPVTPPAGKAFATLGAGCFWCVEAIFLDLKGVEKVESGYSGGHVANPSYKEVCYGTTGHAEVVQITFDPKVISFQDILHIFFTTHDPTTLNRQGADAGTQYRSAVFYHDASQKKDAEEVIKEITAEKLYSNKIVTEVTEYKNYYKAEDYHQNYYAQNQFQPYCQAVIAPKVAKFRQKYRDLLKK